MRFLCMMCYEEAKQEALSPTEFEELVREALDYDDVLKQSGHFVYSDALMPADTAVTLDMSSGKVLLTDGPFAETKEHMGGFYLIEAKDLDEAIGLASKMPPGRLGKIEVRPVRPIK